MRVTPMVVGAAALLAGGSAQGAAQRCADNSLPVYFARGSAELNPASVRILQAAVRRARACRVDAVTLVGRGDAGGPGRGDEGLARGRAETVADALVEQGVPRAAVRIVAKPAEAPVRGVLERRVTVHMHLSPGRAR